MSKTNTIYWSQAHPEALSNSSYFNILKKIPDTFSTRIKRFKREIDRKSSATGLVLLYNLLNYLNINFDLQQLQLNDYKKPLLNNGWYFNISHSGNIVVCCICKSNSVGIDIEERLNIEFKNFQGIFHPTEVLLLKSGNLIDFYSIWTKKEALTKAIGKGVFHDFSSINTQNKEFNIDSNWYQIYNLNLHKNYTCHIASTSLMADVIEIKNDF